MKAIRTQRRYMYYCCTDVSKRCCTQIEHIYMFKNALFNLMCIRLNTSQDYYSSTSLISARNHNNL